eukprot:1390403-Prymnesium_polylepis.2
MRHTALLDAFLRSSPPTNVLCGERIATAHPQACARISRALALARPHRRLRRAAQLAPSSSSPRLDDILSSAHLGDPLHDQRCQDGAHPRIATRTRRSTDSRTIELTIVCTLSAVSALWRTRRWGCASRVDRFGSLSPWMGVHGGADNRSRRLRGTDAVRHALGAELSRDPQEHP